MMGVCKLAWGAAGLDRGSVHLLRDLWASPVEALAKFGGAADLPGGCEPYLRGCGLVWEGSRAGLGVCRFDLSNCIIIWGAMGLPGGCITI